MQEKPGPKSFRYQIGTLLHMYLQQGKNVSKRTKKISVTTRPWALDTTIRMATKIGILIFTNKELTV